MSVVFQTVAVLFSLVYLVHGEGRTSAGVPTTTQQLISLGRSSDGKEYFADPTDRQPWVEAKWVCKANGLRLAEITSKAQFDFLNNTPDPDLEGKYYWTGARDSRLPRQFSWDFTQLEVQSDHWNDPHFGGSYPTCAFMLRGRGTGGGWMAPGSCHDSLFILCEKP